MKDLLKTNCLQKVFGNNQLNLKQLKSFIKSIKIKLITPQENYLFFKI